MGYVVGARIGTISRSTKLIVLSTVSMDAIYVQYQLNMQINFSFNSQYTHIEQYIIYEYSDMKSHMLM